MLSLIQIIIYTVPLSTEFGSFMLLFIKEESLFKVFNNESKLSSAISIIMLLLINNLMNNDKKKNYLYLPEEFDGNEEVGSR